MKACDHVHSADKKADFVGGIYHLKRRDMVFFCTTAVIASINRLVSVFTSIGNVETDRSTGKMVIIIDSHGKSYHEFLSNVIVGETKGIWKFWKGYRM